MKLRLAHGRDAVRFDVGNFGEGSELGKNPHGAERELRAGAGDGLCNEAFAAGAEDAEDFAHDVVAIGDDEEEARDDDHVDFTHRCGERMDVCEVEAAVCEIELGCAGACAGEEVLGKVDAGGADGGVFFGESTGIETGTAAEFKEVGVGWRCVSPP